MLENKFIMSVCRADSKKSYEGVDGLYKTCPEYVSVSLHEARRDRASGTWVRGDTVLYFSKMLNGTHFHYKNCAFWIKATHHCTSIEATLNGQTEPEVFQCKQESVMGPDEPLMVLINVKYNEIVYLLKFIHQLN